MTMGSGIRYLRSYQNSGCEMPYQVVITKQAKKQLSKLGAKQQQLIAAWLKQNLMAAENPRLIPNSKALAGVPGGWRWRVGAYRILGTIEDNLITITVFKIGHRRDVYQGLD